MLPQYCTCNLETLQIRQALLIASSHVHQVEVRVITSSLLLTL